MKKINKVGKAIAAVAIGAGLLAAGGVAGAALFPKQVPVIQEKIVQVEVPVPFEVQKLVEVPVEVPVEVIKVVNQTVEVPVDNGNLDMVQDFIFDREGDLEFITDDLDDDEIDQIVGRIIFFNDAVKLGSDFIKDEFADELDKLVFNGVEFDEDDVERVKVQDKIEDIIVDDVDFEDGDIDLIYEVEFEHDDVDYIGTVKVEFKDGEIDDFEILGVVEE